MATSRACWASPSTRFVALLSRQETSGLDAREQEKVLLQRAVCQKALGRWGEALEGFAFDAELMSRLGEMMPADWTNVWVFDLSLIFAWVLAARPRGFRGSESEPLRFR